MPNEVSELENFYTALFILGKDCPQSDCADFVKLFLNSRISEGTAQNAFHKVARDKIERDNPNHCSDNRLRLALFALKYLGIDIELVKLFESTAKIRKALGD